MPHARKLTKFAVFALIVATFTLPISFADAAVVNGQIQVGDGHDTGYAPDSLDPDSSGRYRLSGPVTSGERQEYDQGLADGDGGEVTTTDDLQIDKSATLEQATKKGTVSLKVEANPVPFRYSPPPLMDFVLVVDVTTSMLQPYRDVPTQSNWQSFWDDRARNYQTRAAVKTAAASIWASNPDSTVTIVPFASGALMPNRNGDGFAYGSFSPNAGVVSLANASADPGVLSHIHIPDTVDRADYMSQSASKAKTDQYPYFKVTQASGGAAFGESIDALPLASDTNTNSGMIEALSILRSGELSATSQRNRVVMLITDGAANIATGTTAAARYEQAGKNVTATSALIKDSGDGNATVSVVSIAPVPVLFNQGGEAFAGSNTGVYAVYSAYDRSGVIKWTDATAGLPPYQPNTQPSMVGTVIDVQNGPDGMATAWATSPAHYYGADDGSGTAVQDIVGAAVSDSIDFSAGLHAQLVDGLNTDAFVMDTSQQPVVTVSIDGGPDLSPGDPGFPDALTVNRTSTGISADLGVVPYGSALTQSSRSVITITYPILVRADLGAHPGQLHTNADDQTYLNVGAPQHDIADSSSVTYPDPTHYYLPFPTPIVPLADDEDAPLLTLVKSDETGAGLDGSTFAIAAPAKATAEVSPKAGKTDQFVLEAGVTYTLTETVAPPGYERLTGPIDVSYDADTGQWSIAGQNAGTTLVADPQNPASAVLTVANRERRGATIDVIVNYYRDSVSGTPLGTDTIPGQVVGGRIRLTTGAGPAQLDHYRPAGYRHGVQQGALPFVVRANGNVIDVLYLRAGSGSGPTPGDPGLATTGASPLISALGALAVGLAALGAILLWFRRQPTKPGRTGR